MIMNQMRFFFNSCGLTNNMFRLIAPMKIYSFHTLLNFGFISVFRAKFAIELGLLQRHQIRIRRIIGSRDFCDQAILICLISSTYC